MHAGRPGTGASSPVRVVFVCWGNICRSPMAERMLAHLAWERLGDAAESYLHSESAGTGGWHVDEPMNPPAARELRRRGAVDEGFRARRLLGAHLDTADLILTATAEHLEIVDGLRPAASHRAFVLGEFGRLFPDRLVNVGIAEQDLVGVGAGLANGGMVPFVSAAAPFLTGRALEQIKADVAYSDTHVVLCGQSPGMSYGELGPTHHSIEDLSWIRAVAGVSIVVPADPAQTRAAVRWAARHDGPSYLRIGRFPVPARASRADGST